MNEYESLGFSESLTLLSLTHPCLLLGIGLGTGQHGGAGAMTHLRAAAARVPEEVRALTMSSR
jgi:hypothetical protein